MPNLNFDQKFYTKDNQQKTEWQGVAVTTSDSADLPNGTCDAIYVTGTGNVTIDTPAITPATGAATSLTNLGFSGVPVASILFVRATRIRTTGTTATGIFALYKASNL